MKRKRNRQMEMMNDAVRNFFSNQLSTKFSQMSFLCACAVMSTCVRAVDITPSLSVCAPEHVIVAEEEGEPQQNEHRQESCGGVANVVR